MTPAPLVTIGLPVRNGGDSLAAALRSLTAQTFRDIEILVSDNASIDDTAAVLAEVAACDPRVRVIRQVENIGAIPNFKAVLREARGAYFCWGAHDDEYDERFVSVLLAELRRDPAAGVAAGGVEIRDDDRPDAAPQVVRFPTDLAYRSPAALSWAMASGRGEYLYLHFGLYRTELLRRLYLPGPLVGGSDWLFILHALLATRVRTVDRVLMVRHMRSSGSSFAKYRGEPGTSSDSSLAWLRAAAPYLARSPVIPIARKPLAMAVLGRFGLWLAAQQGERLLLAAATFLLGDKRRRALGARLRRLSSGRSAGS